MSLNGLDSPAVAKAYQAALDAPEGWFLLKYKSRDYIDTLSTGTGGFGEARAALAAYLEPSPLHGFLQYRGRKALFKYVPAETSRLLQARATVHFRTVSDLFPHDGSIQISTVDEFNEQALSIACSLPPPIIPEDDRPDTPVQLYANGVESQVDNRGYVSPTNELTSLPGSQPYPVSSRSPTPNRRIDGVDSRGASVPFAPRLDHPNPLANHPVHPEEYQAHRHQASLASRPTDIRSEKESVVSHPSSFRGHSESVTGDRTYNSNNARSTSDIFRQGFSGWKPKAKLFPRPIAEDQTQQSQTTSTRQKLPAAFRRKRVPKQKLSVSSNNANLAYADEMSVLSGASREQKTERSLISPPNAPHLTSFENDRTATITSNTIDRPSRPIPPEQSNDILSPEKQRLMRALQLRKQQKENEVKTGPTASELIAAARKNRDKMISPDPGKKADSGVEVDGSEPMTPKVLDQAEKNSFSKPANSGYKASKDSQGKSGLITPPPKVDKRKDKERRTTNANVVTRDEKRRALLQPVQVNVSREHSDVGSVSDESLFDELESATVEEATRVSIPASSPITPLAQTTTSISTISGDGKPSGSAVNSVVIRSTPTRSSPNQRTLEQVQEEAPKEKTQIVRKSNVSSDISRRIQALAELKGREMNVVSSIKPVDEPSSPSFVAVYNRLPSLPEHGKLTTRSQVNVSDTTSLRKMSSQDLSKPESVSITARIVRPATSHGSAPRQRSASLDLHSSQVTVERKAATTPLKQPPEIPLDTALHNVQTSSRPPSRGSVASTPVRKSNESRWNFLRRRESDTKTPVRSLRSSSNASNDSPHETTHDARQTRTSRVFGRLSRQSSPTRKQVNDAGDNSVLVEEQIPVSSAPRPSIVVGDLNVQFPDILFWKRRWVEIDGSGNLVMSASNRKESSRNVQRKYHMSEIKALFLPSRDGQELPHTVALDLFKGGTIQLACEDSIAQGQVFRRLHDVHRAERQLKQQRTQ